MKMNYRFRDSLVGILAILLVFIIFFWPQTVSSWIINIGRPIWALTKSARGNTLEGEIAKFNNEELTALQKDNQELSVVLNGERASSTTGVQGRSRLVLILSYPPVSPFDSVVINSGANQGIKSGDRAVALGALAVGEITTVYQNTAIVRLYSAADQKLQVRLISSASNTSTSSASSLGIVSATGLRSGNFSITLPKQASVNVGDTVVIPGSPPNILGQIEKIDTTPSDSFQTLYLKIPVNIRQISYLEIETND